MANAILNLPEWLISSIVKICTFPPPNAAKIRLKLKPVVMANAILNLPEWLISIIVKVWLQLPYTHRPVHSLHDYLPPIIYD